MIRLNWLNWLNLLKLKRKRILAFVLTATLVAGCMPFSMGAAFSLEGESTVVGRKTETSGVVNLTQNGSVDWIQFNAASVESFARKNVAKPTISGITAIGAISSSPVTDCPFTFDYDDPDMAQGSKPEDNRGVEVRGLGSGYSFTIPYRNGDPQNLKVYSSVWAGNITFEFIVNGVARYKDEYGKGLESNQAGQCFSVDFTAAADDVIEVKLYCSENFDTQWGGASHCLQAITLSGSSEPTDPVVSGKLAQTSGVVDLTGEGSVDWIQFSSVNIGKPARKTIESPAIVDIAANRAISNKVITDCPFSFIWKDAASGQEPISNTGVEIRGLGSEHSFKLPYIDSKPYKLKVYSSVWGGDITLEFRVNGETLYSDDYSNVAPDGQLGQAFEIDYQLFNSTDIAEVRLICSVNRDLTWGGASNCLQAITLGSESALPPPPPSHSDYPNFLMTATACSQETVSEYAPTSYAVDGSPSTFWHTSWRAAANDNTSHENGANSAHNKNGVENGHWIQIDLGAVTKVSGLRYLPRQNSANGRITSALVYISLDGKNFSRATDLLEWAATADEKTARFDAADARYVLLLSKAPALYCTAGEITIETPYAADRQEVLDRAKDAIAAINSAPIGDRADQYPPSERDKAYAAIVAAMSDPDADAAIAEIDAALANFSDAYVRYSLEQLLSVIADADELYSSNLGNDNVTSEESAAFFDAITAAKSAAQGSADDIHVAYKSISAAIVKFNGAIVDVGAKRLTPIMGWASWNNYRATIDEAKLIKQMDALVSTGLADAGYTFFNIDDGFFGGRDENGGILTHPIKFPNGMKMFADRAHDMGLSAGIYTDAGSMTCASIWDRLDVGTYGDEVGLYGFEEQDLRMYLNEWGYDFIKVDWCGGERLNLDEKTQYEKIGAIIEKIRSESGRYKVYNVCRWQFPGEWVVDVADSWRVGSDIRADFSSVMYQIDQVTSLAQYHGPGHVNDLDMMQVGNGMTAEEDKTHFTMWSMMSAPLMLGNDLTTISEQTLEIVTNEEIIALDQDPACKQATLFSSNQNSQIWVKDLESEGSSTKAVALLNRGSTAATISVNFADLGLDGDLTARDLWLHEDIDVGATYETVVPSHGVVVLKVSKKSAPPVKDNTTTADISFADGKVTITAHMSRNTDAGYSAANVIGAAYNARGVMVAIESKTVDLSELGKSVDLSFDLTLPTGLSADDVTVKLFTWAPSTFAPLDEAIDINISAPTASSPTPSSPAPRPNSPSTGLIDSMVAKDLVVKGAILIDVRTPEEFAAGHIEGAINIEHNAIIDMAEKEIPSKESVIVAYCSAGKRSSQAVNSLRYLGYENVYNMGAMSVWNKDK